MGSSASSEATNIIQRAVRASAGAVPYVTADQLANIKNMRSARFRRYASLDPESPDHWSKVMQMDEVPVPEVEGDKVLIQVAACSANAYDARHILGGISSFLPAPPTSLGGDVAGVVVKVGPGVKRFQVGDRVYGGTNEKDHTGFSQFVAESEDKFALKPENMSFVEAATLQCSGVTGYDSFQDAELKEGDRVLIIGASGGCGTFGIQLALAMGASEVVGVCSGQNEELVRNLGASSVVDYTKTPWGKALEGADFDIVYDTVGKKEYWDEAKHVLKSSGKFVTLAAMDAAYQDKITPFMLIGALSKHMGRKLGSFFGGPGLSMTMAKSTPEKLEYLSKLAEDGKLKPQIQQVHSFDEAGVTALIGNIVEGRSKGKNVLKVTPWADEI